MNSITNTTQEDKELFLLEALMCQHEYGDPTRAIERQEARGQREACAQTSQLPTDIKPGDRLALERQGFRFLGPCDEDPLFQRVTFPEGWRLAATSHSMWSDLVDPRGRKRGRMFYKAAFYDRGAHLRLNARYYTGWRSEGEGSDSPRVPAIFDNARVIGTDKYGRRQYATVWEGERFVPMHWKELEKLPFEERLPHFEAQDRARKTADVKLDELYPLCAGYHPRDPERHAAQVLAYWDEAAVVTDWRTVVMARQTLQAADTRAPAAGYPPKNPPTQWAKGRA